MKKIFVLALLMIFAFTACVYAAETQSGKEAKLLKTTTEEGILVSAKDVFNSINNSFERGIPRGLVYTAQAIAIFPKSQGGGVIVGGMGGRGVILYKNKDKWSTPAFLRIAGASVGLQLGFQEVDLVLVLMNKNDIEGILKSKLKLGVDAGLAVGPVGRDANVSMDAQAKSIIYSYSRARGVYAGVKLEGSTVSPDEKANKALYGKDFDTRAIIMDGKAKSTPAGKDLIKTIEEYTKK